MRGYLIDLGDEGAIMAPVFAHYAPEGHDLHSELLRQVRQIVCCIAVQVWWRFIFSFENSFDIKLLKIFRATETSFNRHVGGAEIWNAPECCKNPNFSNKVLSPSVWEGVGVGVGQGLGDFSGLGRGRDVDD